MSIITIYYAGKTSRFTKLNQAIKVFTKSTFDAFSLVAHYLSIQRSSIKDLPHKCAVS